MRAARAVELVTGTLAAMLAETLRLSGPDAIAPEQSLLDLGLDSLVALELTDRLTKVFGRPFRATLFFSYPNLRALAQYVLNELSPSLPRRSSTKHPTTSTRTTFPN